MSDYIEREALLDVLDECIEKCEKMLPITPAQVHEMQGEINATKAIRVFVKRFDADDVRPVVQGKWQFHMFTANSLGYECRVCHTTWDAPTNYCPNCGARMLPEPPKEET